jgi:hypothetical protein
MNILDTMDDDDDDDAVFGKHLRASSWGCMARLSRCAVRCR